LSQAEQIEEYAATAAFRPETAMIRPSSESGGGKGGFSLE